MPAELVNQDLESQNAVESNVEIFRFSEIVNDIASDVPEVAERQDAIVEYGQELVEEFGIDKTLFTDKAHAFFFVALADRYSQLETRRAEMTVSEYAKHKEFVADAVMMLARDKSEYYDSVKDLLGVREGLTEHDVKEVHDRFTNRQVTEELREAIDKEGLLDAVKQRLGVTPDNEDPYELRVLNVATDQIAIGMRPLSSEDLKDYEAYIGGLRDNTEEFSIALGGREIGVAWNVTLDGVRYLNVPLPIAEKLLYTSEQRGPEHTNRIRERDFGVLEHEYTHTQGGLNLDSRTYYGIEIEEVRAEQFSDNKNGYEDAKGFIDDLAVAANFNIRGLLNSPKGGFPGEFYTALATKIGLQETLEFALTIPGTYKGGDPENLQTHTSNYVGDPDSLIQRVYEKSITDPDKAQEIQDRITRIAMNIKNSPDEGDTWLNQRSGLFGLYFMTDKIREARDRTS
jgi:hypothetical protein